MPGRPKELIFILGEQEISRLEYDGSGRNLLSNEDVLIISIDSSRPSKILSKIKYRGLFRRGIVLIKSPYDDENYEEITNAAYEFAVEKYMYFSQFCNLLGAKEVTVQRLDKITKKEMKSLEFIANLPAGQQEILAKDKELSKIHSQIHIRDVFEGGVANVDGAEALLHKKKLLGDSTMNSLLEIRRQVANPISSRQLTLNLSKETKRIIEIAGKIRPPQFLSEVTTNFETVEKNLAEYSLTLQVTF